MATSEEQPIKRKRGRPPGTGHLQRAAQRQGYTGPGRAQVNAMSDQDVLAAYDTLKVEPMRFPWHDDDNQLNIARWSGYPVGVDPNDEQLIPDAKQIKTDEDILKVKAIAWQLYQGWLRARLLATFIRQWIDSLDDTRLLVQRENLTGEQLSESAARYAKRNDLAEEVFQGTWREVIKQSTNNSEKGV